MIARLRLLLALSRPPVVLLLAGYAAIGVAAAGGRASHPALALLHALPAVAGFLVFSVCLNDIADEAVDRVNLAPQRGRPLLDGSARRADLAVTGAVAALLAIAVAASIGLLALTLLLAGLGVSAAYSLPPVSVSSRGLLASLVLPACYVVVPFGLGACAAGGRIGAASGWLLGGLCVGFVGRILLKDFRDLHGDALFGKRTFLVRRGRRATCLTSAAFWAAGTALLIVAVSRSGRPWGVTAASYVLGLAAVCALLRMLADDDGGPRRDERIISAIAIVGRGLLLVLLAQLSGRRVDPVVLDGLLAAMTALTAAQATVMLRHGPVRRCTVPAEWVAEQQPAGHTPELSAAGWSGR